MAEVGESLARSVRHCCNFPSYDRPIGHQWTCPLCRRTWTLTERHSSMTDEPDAEIVGVTFRYPDGSEQTFSEL